MGISSKSNGNRRSMIAQVSIEYILLVSFLLLLYLPIAYYSGQQRINFVSYYSMAQTDVSLTRLASTVDYVYFLGRDNEITIDVYFPVELTTLTVGGGVTNQHEIKATFMDGREIVKTTRGNISQAAGILTPINPGNHQYLVRYVSDPARFGVEVVPK